MSDPQTPNAQDPAPESAPADPPHSAIIEPGNMPMVVYFLYLVGAALPILAIAGLIIAYLKRGEAAAFHGSHYSYLIRTFWIGLLYSVIAALLAFVVIGFILLLVVAIWYLVRVIKGMLAFNEGKPISDPQTWLI